jgi:hypothetical protein
MALIAALVLEEQTREQIDAALQVFLSDKLSVGGTAQRGARQLSKAPPEFNTLTQMALAYLPWPLQAMRTV